MHMEDLLQYYACYLRLHVTRSTLSILLCSCRLYHCRLHHKIATGTSSNSLVTPGDLVADRYTYAPTHCRTSKYRRTFISFSVPLYNDLGSPV